MKKTMYNLNFVKLVSTIPKVDLHGKENLDNNHANLVDKNGPPNMS